jgi:hypothetical protein
METCPHSLCESKFWSGRSENEFTRIEITGRESTARGGYFGDLRYPLNAIPGCTHAGQSKICGEILCNGWFLSGHRRHSKRSDISMFDDCLILRRAVQHLLRFSANIAFQSPLGFVSMGSFRKVDRRRLTSSAPAFLLIVKDCHEPVCGKEVKNLMIAIFPAVIAPSRRESEKPS